MSDIKFATNRPCKRCGAPIFFAVNEKTNGRMPLDATPVKRIVIERHRVNEETGEATPIVNVVDTYTTHFQTCPNADEFRKGRSNA